MKQHVLVAVLLLGAALLSPTSPAHAAGIPAAGTTTVRANGSGTVLLHMPEQTMLPESEISLELTDGTFAFVGLETSQCAFVPGRREICMEYQAYLWNEAGGALSDPPVISLPDPPRVAAGPVRVYVVSDGIVEFTAGFQGLDGTLDVTADEPLKSAIARLPITCDPADPCVRGYGGVTKELPGRQFAAALAFSRRPAGVSGTPVPVGNFAGSNSVEACVYPGPDAPDGSPAPADHPHGCNIIPDGAPDTDELNRIASTVSQARQVQVVGWGSVEQTLLAPVGPVYLGFHGTQVDAIEQSGSMGGLGMWLSLKSP